MKLADLSIAKMFKMTRTCTLSRGKKTSRNLLKKLKF